MQVEIGCALMLPPSTVSRRPARLQERGLSVRAVDPQDARRRELRATGSGAALLEEAARTLAAAVRERLESLAPAELDSFLDALGKLAVATPAES